MLHDIVAGVRADERADKTEPAAVVAREFLACKRRTMGVLQLALVAEHGLRSNFKRRFAAEALQRRFRVEEDRVFVGKVEIQLRRIPYAVLRGALGIVRSIRGVHDGLFKRERVEPVRAVTVFALAVVPDGDERLEPPQQFHLIGDDVFLAEALLRRLERKNVIVRERPDDRIVPDAHRPERVQKLLRARLPVVMIHEIRHLHREPPVHALRGERAEEDNVIVRVARKEQHIRLLARRLPDLHICRGRAGRKEAHLAERREAGKLDIKLRHRLRQREILVQKAVLAAGDVPRGGMDRECFARGIPVKIKRGDGRFGGNAQRVPGAVVDAGGAVAVAEDRRVAADTVREGDAVRDLRRDRLGRGFRRCGRFGRGRGRRLRRRRGRIRQRGGSRRLWLRRCAAGGKKRAEQREYQKKRNTFFRGGCPFSRGRRGVGLGVL